jgi:hypothetical protein
MKTRFFGSVWNEWNMHCMDFAVRLASRGMHSVHGGDLRALKEDPLRALKVKVAFLS